MALRPLHDRVIVKRLDNERTTASGIVMDGKVIAVDVKVGDKVLFGKYAGQSVKVDGEEVLVIREEEILAVIQ